MTSDTCASEQQTSQGLQMNVLFSCPRCHGNVNHDIDESTLRLTCPACQTVVQVSGGAVHESRLEKCLVCPSTDLFVRKNFPQRVGVTIVVIGFAISCLTWFYHMVIATFVVLFATALLDVVLYVIVGDVVECYRCHARYQGVEDNDRHEAFDLEVHERHRQQQARLTK
jgi:hypothetical protein